MGFRFQSFDAIQLHPVYHDLIVHLAWFPIIHTCKLIWSFMLERHASPQLPQAPCSRTQMRIALQCLLLFISRVRLRLILLTLNQCRPLGSSPRSETGLISFRPVGNRRRLGCSCRRWRLDLVLAGPPLLDEGQELGLAGDVFAQDLGNDEALGGLVVLKDAAECAFGGAD